MSTIIDRERQYLIAQLGSAALATDSINDLRAKFYSGGASAGVGSYAEQTAWKAALANRDYAPAKVLCIGDSITEGQGATTAGAPWVACLKKSLLSRYVPAANFINNYRPAKTFQSSYTTEWTIGGTPSNPFDYGLARNAMQLTAGTMSLTLNVTGTSVKISYFANGSLGTFSWAVDGGAATNVNTATALTDNNLVNIVFGARGAHTVTLNWVSGTVVIHGAYIYDGDENAGIQVVNAGHSGFNSKQFAVTYSTTRFTESIAAYAPHLVTIGLGANDYNAANNITPSDFYNNISTIIGVVNAATPAAKPSIILLGYPKRGDYTNPTYSWQSYLDALATLDAENSNVSFLNLAARMPDGTDTVYGLYADQLHPSNKGHRYIADAVYGFITQ